MNKVKLLFVVDLMGFLSFLVVAFTGFYRWLYLSRVVAQTPQEAMKLISVGNDMRFVHDWAAVLLTIVICIHVLLHLPWIKNAFKIVFKKKEKNIPTQ